jgi:uncharacterized protein (DUF488 family)
MNPTSLQVFTIGHSTRNIDEFLGLLHIHQVKALIDVRAFPGSRRQPQFNKETLDAALRQDGISYRHMVSLGGRRKRQDVIEHDTHWRNPTFANYADYTKTDAFRAALAELETVAREQPSAIMCAEALWWKCHRRIIADALAKDGFAITHIMDARHDRDAARSPELPGLG